MGNENFKKKKGKLKSSGPKVCCERDRNSNETNVPPTRGAPEWGSETKVEVKRTRRWTDTKSTKHKSDPIRLVRVTREKIPV